jgi:hypothetical protein
MPNRFLAVLTLVVVAGVLHPAHAAILQTRDIRGSAGELLCVDVAGGTQANGTSLITYRCHGGSNQSFTFNRATGELRSALGNWCIDVSQGIASSGARVQLWTCNGSAAQKFRYDRASGAVRFAANTDYCLDFGGGGTVKLWSCNGTAPQRFDLSTPYGMRRFDELTWLTAHNAFNNPEDSRWVVTNQSRGITHALNDGVRALMLDVWSFESSTARCIASFGSDCYKRDLYLCHEHCDGVPGIGYALPRQTAGWALSQVVNWLGQHPDEIVTVFLEDYSTHDELKRTLDGVAGLRDVLFDPYAWNVTQSDWPRARDLIDANKRLLVISDRSEKRDLGIAFGQDFTVENYWSTGTFGDKLACTSRWGNIGLDATDARFHRLFVMNHFRDIPTGAGAASDNGYGKLTSRLNDNCLPAARRKPNYIAVDYYESGGDGGAARFVRDIGRATAILFGDGNYGGRGQLIGPGYTNTGALGVVGNDAVSSLKVLDGWFLTVYEHGDYGGRSRTFTGDTPWIGNDWNDLVSSVQSGLVSFAFDDPGVPFQ